MPSRLPARRPLPLFRPNAGRVGAPGVADKQPVDRRGYAVFLLGDHPLRA